MEHPEKLMWKELSRSIGFDWDACRHENQFGEGMPDVSFGTYGINGWIELKFLPEWPARPTTIVTIPHMDHVKKQLVWLWRRGCCGGHCFFLLKVGIQWLLFDHITARKIGSLTRGQMEAAAIEFWTGVPSSAEFLHLITK